MGNKILNDSKVKILFYIIIYEYLFNFSIS